VAVAVPADQFQAVDHGGGRHSFPKLKFEFC
jgi:hypothetical protein